ncbi:MAG TPA: hypothetical protein VN937_24685 [Blastocatellia bacterium]|jgi:hypothetical protein|nr:hypothetical protein [Blastocatellia bacterium]
MATISTPTVAVTNLTATTVTVTVKYTLTPSSIEKLAGTVFSEKIQLIGDDPGVISDIVITNFPEQTFVVSSSTASLNRVRTRTVLKSAMNEDPEFRTTGSEVVDETLARITLGYAANAPTSPTLPPPTSTNTVTGAWK